MQFLEESYKQFSLRLKYRLTKMLSKVKIVIYREKKEISKHKQVPINFRMKLGIKATTITLL